MRKFLVSQIEFGKFIDISPKWIQELERRGIFKKTSEKKYDLKECVPAYVQFLRGSKDKTLAAAQTAHLEMRTKKLALETKRLEGSLVLKSEFQEKIASFVTRCEENFRNLPHQVAPVLARLPISDERLIAMILRHQINHCWRDLAGIPRKKPPMVFPGEMILVSLGLIQGDENGEVIVNSGSTPKRVKIIDLLEKYGSGIDALKIPTKEERDGFQDGKSKDPKKK